MNSPVGWVGSWAALNPEPPAILKTWMEYRDSITDLAKQHFQHVNVEVIAQGWQSPFLDEAHSVNEVATELAIIREIFMKCDGERCWFARTVIPTKTYQEFQSAFDDLGTTPIGTLLHHQNEVSRSAFQYSWLTPDAPLHGSIVNAYPELADESLWARRSVFYLKGHPLLLQEIFLPAFLACLNK